MELRGIIGGYRYHGIFALRKRRMSARTLKISVESYASWRKSVALDRLIDADESEAKSRAARWAAAWGIASLASRLTRASDQELRELLAELPIFKRRAKRQRPSMARSRAA